jgi:predicted restriction endonuclease
MDAATRSMVRQRAGNRCEYCGILQEQMSAAAFHVDHIIPKQHGAAMTPHSSDP